MDLHHQLKLAVEQEDYESAAVIRDMLDYYSGDKPILPLTGPPGSALEGWGPDCAYNVRRRNNEALIYSESLLGDSKRLHDLIAIHHKAVSRLLDKRMKGCNPIQVYKVIDTKEMSLAYMILDEVILKIHYHEKGFKVQ